MKSTNWIRPVVVLLCFMLEEKKWPSFDLMSSSLSFKPILHNCAICRTKSNWSSLDLELRNCTEYFLIFISVFFGMSTDSIKKHAIEMGNEKFRNCRMWNLKSRPSTNNCKYYQCSCNGVHPHQTRIMLPSSNFYNCTLIFSPVICHVPIHTTLQTRLPHEELIRTMHNHKSGYSK